MFQGRQERDLKLEAPENCTYWPVQDLKISKKLPFTKNTENKTPDIDINTKFSKILENLIVIDLHSFLFNLLELFEMDKC